MLAGLQFVNPEDAADSKKMPTIGGALQRERGIRLDGPCIFLPYIGSKFSAMLHEAGTAEKSS